MQPTEGFNVSRRALDVEDYIDILRRHKGWIFGPFLLTLVASVVGVYFYPDTYVSQAMVKITPQQIPENMVQSAVNQRIAERISAMEQTIRSRGVLTNIINTYNLYPREKTKTTIEDLVVQMNSKISVVPVMAAGGDGRSVPAFYVEFSYDNRVLAQKVTEDLVGRFMEENQRDRTNATWQTTQFMQQEMESAKKELDATESKLAEFQIQNNGHLPDQLQSNMSQLNSLQAQVTYLDGQINRANQDKVDVQTSIRIAQDQLTALQKEPSANSTAQLKNQKLADAEHEIQTWNDKLSELHQRLTDKNPDVVYAEGRLAAAKTKRDEIFKEESSQKPEAPVAKTMDPQSVREARDLNANIQRWQSTIQSRDVQIEEYSKELKKVNEAIKSYQGRIESLPMGAKQYGDLIRDRELAKDKYEHLHEQLDKAQIAQNMEGRKQGELLELLDPASLPQDHSEPKRPMVISIGAAVGLLFGIVIAGAREMKDTSLKNLKDVRAYTQMAILGSVPLLENDFVVRRRKRLAWLGWTTACLVAVVVMSGSVAYYYMTRA